MLTQKVALYTTIYPGVEKYLAAWYQSVQRQTDQEFDIWVGVDELEPDTIIAAFGEDPQPVWIIAEEGDTPADIRQKAISKIIEQYPAIVFVDSDDILEPTRVEGARKALEQSDVNGCAMRIIDANGKDLELVFAPNDVNLNSILPKYNVFGFSNTIYRSDVLHDCLPVPSKCTLVDWFIITRAWAKGYRLTFDPNVRMAYRQHEANLAKILPPFTSAQILLATQRVLEHFQMVLEHIPELTGGKRLEVEKSQLKVKHFYQSISRDPGILAQYVMALNQMPPEMIWWSNVANPRLEAIWIN